MFVQKLIFKQAQALKLQRVSVYGSKLFTPAILRTFASNIRSFQTQDALKVIESLKSGQDVQKNSETVDEYFRVNFRKLGFEQACQLLEQVSDIYELEDKFWVWETLEEAIRPKLIDVPDDKFDQIHTNFRKLHKGSRYLWFDVEDRISGRISIL